MTISAPIASDAWPVRAVQLDLARQRETLDTIRRFIDFAARWGHNTLHLYLEGVIRTDSFPYRSPDVSYSPDDVRQIVDAADAHGMEVVPCINTLGHAEHFTQCKELAHLAETGRPSPGGHMFCPSLPETYEFLQQYLGEIAALFPSDQFNIGGDEAWQLGACPRCRQRIEAGETWADLFIAHTHRIVRMMQGLGKRRFWMWEDLLEFFDESQIDQLPRELVMCAWHYDPDDIGPAGIRGHFSKQRRHDWLELYGRLGFDVLIAPGTVSSENLLAFNRHARRHHVLGGLQTMWELSNRFVTSQMPHVALAGYTWANPTCPADEAINAVCEALCPTATEPARTALHRVFSGKTPARLPKAPAALYQGPATLAETQNALAVTMEEQLLRSLRPGPDEPWAASILRDLHTEARERVVGGQLRQILPLAIDPRFSQHDRDQLIKPAQGCRTELAALAEVRAAQWREQRGGLGEDTASPRYHELDAKLAPIVDHLHEPLPAGQAVVELSLFLYEAYSLPKLVVELCVDGQWRELASGVYKPLDLQAGFFTVQRPTLFDETDASRLEALRFTVTGYGGQGISYAAIRFADRSWVPAAVVETTGPVATPHLALRDDATCCYLGHPDTVDTLMNFREDEPAVLELTLHEQHHHRAAPRHVAQA